MHHLRAVSLLRELFPSNVVSLLTLQFRTFHCHNDFFALVDRVAVYLIELLLRLLLISVTQRYEYVFSENGLVAHKNGQLISKEVVQQLNKLKSTVFFSHQVSGQY